MGLEPTTAAMARRYSSQLSYTCKQDIFIIYKILKNQENFQNFFKILETKFQGLIFVYFLCYLLDF